MVEGGEPVFGEAEVAHEFEVACPGGQLDHVRQVLDGFEAAFTAASVLTSRVMFFSSIAWRSFIGMASMNWSPRRMRSTLVSSKTRSTPGSPSEAPVMHDPGSCGTGGAVPPE